MRLLRLTQGGGHVYFFYYYPIGVDVPRPRVPWLTIGLALTMVSVFLASMPLAHLNRFAWFDYMYRPAQVSVLHAATAVFLHGSWMHLAGNLLYLGVFGPSLERALGRVGLFLVFVGTGALGNLLHGVAVVNYYPELAWSGVVGASGAISGLLGMFLLRFPWARLRLAYWVFMPLQGVNKTGVAHLPAVLGVLLWVVMQVAFYLLQGGKGGTAYGAHLGGLMVGVLLALSLAMPRRAAVERLRVLADRHREKGNAHGAVGGYRRYLERAPWDEEAWLEYARCLAMARDVGKAMSVYRQLVERRLEEGETEAATRLYLEGRRGNQVFNLPTPAQRKVAFWLEKSGQYAEAADAYIDLARFSSTEDDSVHALARAATLMATRLGDRRGGRDLLEQTLRQFPESSLRSLLEAEHRKLSPRRSGWAGAA